MQRAGKIGKKIKEKPFLNVQQNCFLSDILGAMLMLHVTTSVLFNLAVTAKIGALFIKCESSFKAYPSLCSTCVFRFVAPSSGFKIYDSIGRSDEVYDV